MNVWTEPKECDLCGVKGQPMHVQLIEWLDALPGMKYAWLNRCDDRAGCRARVQVAGKPWPIIDGKGIS